MYLCYNQTVAQRCISGGFLVFRLSLTVCLIFIFSARVYAKDLNPVFGAHPGYLFDIEEEKTKRDLEMVLIEKPSEDHKPLGDIIVDRNLSKEFQDQYKIRFGQTSAEQVINTDGRNEGYTYYNSQTISGTDYRLYQRQFGEYMARRLVEVHFDNWAKNDPVIRPAYEFKDRISNLNVQITKSYKLKWKYSFAGPSMEATLENPYDVEARVQAPMLGAISKPTEYIFSCGYPVTNRVRLGGVYWLNREQYQMVVSRRLNNNISTSLSGLSDTASGHSLGDQYSIVVGFSWGG